MPIIIKIAEDFSLYPGPRYIRLGDCSGEEFRDKKLIPALEKKEGVEVHLDGTRGYGSSFLEEAFGGTVRAGHSLTSDILTLVTNDSSLEKEIWDYIKDAIKIRKRAK